jgi:hypothetical protein
MDGTFKSFILSCPFFVEAWAEIRADQDAEAEVQFPVPVPVPVPAGNQLAIVQPVTVTIYKLGRLTDTW